MRYNIARILLLATFLLILATISTAARPAADEDDRYDYDETARVVRISLPAGTATLRLARFDHEHEYFEIDAPKTTIAAEQTGLYRLDVAENGNVRITVRDGGRARLYS